MAMQYISWINPSSIVILIDRYDTKLRIMRQESTESRKDFTGFY